MTALIPGVDVSAHNASSPSMRWPRFGVVRASYGPRPDRRYDQHVGAFRRANRPVGAYHFGVRWWPIAKQVETFLSVADEADFLALDVERDGILPRMSDAQAREFIRRVQDEGLRIGLYMSASMFRDLGQDWDWVARYGVLGAAQGYGDPGRSWDMWQWQGSPLDRDWLREPLDVFLAKAGNRHSLVASPPRPAGGQSRVTSETHYTGRWVVLPPGTRSFVAVPPFGELDPVSGMFEVDGQVVLEGDGPHGTFLRIVTGAAGRRLVPEGSATPIPRPVGR